MPSIALFQLIAQKTIWPKVENGSHMKVQHQDLWSLQLKMPFKRGSTYEHSRTNITELSIVGLLESLKNQVLIGHWKSTSVIFQLERMARYLKLKSKVQKDKWIWISLSAKTFSFKATASFFFPPYFYSFSPDSLPSFPIFPHKFTHSETFNASSSLPLSFLKNWLLARRVEQSSKQTAAHHKGQSTTAK